MKHSSGFTLVELLVGIVIMAVVLGSVIAIFGNSSKAAKLGLNQQEAFEEARLVMEELKTTLRYADKDTVIFNPEGTKLTYSGKYFDKHFDLSNGANVAYSMEVDFSNGKQLKITKKLIRDNKETTTKIIFPKNENNSAFKADVADGQSKKWLKWLADGNSFPIREELMPTSSVTENQTKNKVGFSVTADEYTEPEQEVAIYTILLPVKYLDENKKPKIDVLETKVLPSNYDGEGDQALLVYKHYTRITESASKWGGNNSGWDNLNSAEKAELQKFYDYYYNQAKKQGIVSGLSSKIINSNIFFPFLGNNDKIRQYLLNKYRDNSFPAVVFDDGSSKGLKLYIQPYGKEDASGSLITIPTENVFVCACIDGSYGGGWYTKVIYNHETQTWYSGSGFNVKGRTWPEVWSEMQSRGWQPIPLKNGSSLPQ